MIYSIFKNEKLFRVLLFICIVSIEFLATTTIEIKVIESTWDKANHLVAFFTLYMLLSLSISKLGKYIKFIYLFIFALQIEIVQYFIEGRYFSSLDIIADMLGIFIGIIIYKYFSILFLLNTDH